MLPDPELVTTIAAMRAPTPDSVPVPALVSVERHHGRTVLVLDDGVTVDVDAEELLEAVGPVSDRPFWHGLRDRAA